MKQYLPLPALALAGLLVFGAAAHARDRTAEDLNAPWIVRSSMDEPVTVARRGNQIFIYNRGGSLERTTLVTKGPAVIAEAPMREGKRVHITTQRTMAEPIAEGPAGEVKRSRLITTRTTFLTSGESSDVVVEGSPRTAVISTSSRPEAIAEGPSSEFLATSLEPEMTTESTTFEVRKAGGLFTPDGLTLSGRGPYLLDD